MGKSHRREQEIFKYMKQPLVSIIIPTKNAGSMLENALKSIKTQTYKNIEVLVVDSASTDNTRQISEKYNAKYLTYIPKVRKDTFDAPYKRNYGVKKARGTYVYYMDADMRLTKQVIEQSVKLCRSGYGAVIIPEDSYGVGQWAQAKNLERRCYWGDDSVEAPRFVQKKIWNEVGGLDETLGGGGDDWDLYQKILDRGYLVGRTTSLALNNEGNLRLRDLIKKRFMYGRDSARYIQKRPKEGIKSYFPIRKGYVKNWKLFLSRPVDTINFIIMRFAEYAAGFSGIIYGNVINK